MSLTVERVMVKVPVAWNERETLVVRDGDNVFIAEQDTDYGREYDGCGAAILMPTHGGDMTVGRCCEFCNHSAAWRIRDAYRYAYPYAVEGGEEWGAVQRAADREGVAVAVLRYVGYEWEVVPFDADAMGRDDVLVVLDNEWRNGIDPVEVSKVYAAYRNGYTWGVGVVPAGDYVEGMSVSDCTDSVWGVVPAEMDSSGDGELTAYEMTTVL